MRTRIILIGYDGKKKGGNRTVSGDRWWTIRNFETIDEARKAGATKFTPRYNRVSL